MLISSVDFSILPPLNKNYKYTLLNLYYNYLTPSVLRQSKINKLLPIAYFIKI